MAIRSIAHLLGAALLAVACLSAPAHAATELVKNGGFETPTVRASSQQLDTYQPTDNAALAAAGFGWTIGGHSIDVVRRFWAPASGLQSLDLTGDRPGSIAQALATSPGSTYILRFKYSSFKDSGGNVPSMTMRWGTTVSRTYTFTGRSSKQDMGWVSVELELPATAAMTTLSFAANDDKGGNPHGVALDDVSVQLKAAPPAAFGPPVLLRAVAQAGGGALLMGRIDGAASGALTLQVSSSASCSNGVLVSGTALAAVPISTDPAGYFIATIPSVPSGRWLAAQVTAPVTSAVSSCVVNSADNDFWPKALELAGDASQAGDYVDVPGRSRWYKLAVQPGQRLVVKLSALPADYDIAVFKDIGQAFADLLQQATTTADITKLSAEFAPSMFSPSMFSPSMFSPSMFSPEEIVQAFSSAQTRSLVAYAATPGTADELTVVNTWNNTGYFYVRVAGRGGASSSSGQFRLDLTRGPTTCAPVTDLAISRRAAEAAGNTRAVILVDGTRIDLAASLPGGGTLAAKLDALALRVGGVVRDVGSDARVAALRSQADANPTCPFAKNLLARELKGIVDAYRAGNPLKYVVLVGSDSVIPFFRYPDQTLLGQESGYVPPVQSNSASEASLRRDYVLNQDAYGAKRTISLRVGDFPVPDLAVGRLVETPADIGGVIDAFLKQQGAIVPATSLVTGYDFLADAATAVKAELDAGLGVGQPNVPATASAALIAPNNVSPRAPQAWNADALKQSLLGSRHDVVFLAGHFSANSALAADFQTGLVTYDLLASSVDLANALVFSAGCHAGYNLVDAHAIDGVTWPLDWAQAFARKKATLVAGTGYQYGDTDLLEYSERLYRNFARQLHAGVGPVAVGDALVKAKLEYLATTPDVRGLHEKAVLEATLFGLPMLAFDMPFGRAAAPAPDQPLSTAPVATAPGKPLGLQTTTQTWNFAPLARSLDSRVVDTLSTNITSGYLEGTAGITSNPAEPVLPLYSFNVTPTSASLVLRGVGFRGGAFNDVTVVPLTGAPATELRGVHGPFTSPVFFPMRLATPSYFGALSDAGGGATRLLVTPAQHRAADPANFTTTRREYGSMSVKLYYSGIPGDPALAKSVLSDAPSIVTVDATGSPPLFTAQVVGDPAAGVQDVWVTWTTGAGTWQSLDLVQCTGSPLPAACGTTDDSRIWKGRLGSEPGPIQFIVQAASGTGLVTLDDNFGEYYVVNAAARTATTLAFVSPPATVAFGAGAQIAARLTTAGNAGVAGKLVAIGVGPNAQVARTDATGAVVVTLPTAAVPGNYALTASFGGDNGYKPASATAGFAIQRAATSIASASPAGATLTATLGSRTQAMSQETIQFSLTGTRYSGPVFAIADYAGTAALPPPGLPAGTYNVTAASFAGNATYLPSSASLSQVLVVPKRPQAVVFDMPLPDVAAGAPDLTVFAVASSQLPATFAAVAGSTCTVTNGPAPGTATVQLVGAGTCGIRASQAGDVDWLAATDVIRTFAITGGAIGAFAPTGSMNIAREAHTSTLLDDGRVLIVGGFDASLNPIGSYEIYDPVTGLFSGPFPMGSGMAVGGHTATKLTNVAGDGTSGLERGSVLIVGGAVGGGPNVGWFNPAKNSFSVLDSPAPEFDRIFATASLLPDGRVMVAGGSDAAGTIQSTALFDPTVSPPTYGFGPLMDRDRELHDATSSADGARVLISGGRDSVTTNPVDSLQLYRSGYVNDDPFDSGGQFDPTVPMVTPRYFHKGVQRGADYALVGGTDVGGAPATGATASVECFGDVPAHSSTPCGTPLLQGRRVPTVTLLTDNSVLVAGGKVGSSTVLASTERSAAPAAPFVPGPTLATPRWFHQATRLYDGRVLITGGVADASNTPVASAELFTDPALDGSSPPGSPMDTLVHASPTRYSPHTGPIPATFDLWTSGDRPTGTVSIHQDDPAGPVLCSTPALDGNSHGTCTPSPALDYGPYSLFLVYTPADGRNKPSAWPFPLYVADWSVIDFQMSPSSPPNVGDTVTLTGMLTYANANTLTSDGATISGVTLNFYDGGVPIAGCQGVDVNSDGFASCTYKFSSAGTRWMRAEFNGTAHIRQTATEFPVTVSP